MTRNTRASGGPTAADLAAIEGEWPLIEAELTLLDAEIRMLAASGGPSPLDWRRLRRAEHQALAVRLRLVPATETVPRHTRAGAA